MADASFTDPSTPPSRPPARPASDAPGEGVPNPSADAGTDAHAGCLERLDASQRRDHQAAQHLVRYDWAARFVPEGARVLDCACGTGYGTRLLRERGAGSVLGIDSAPEALEHARREHTPDGVEYRRADALSLSPDDVGRFDRIVCLETIEHVGEPKRLLDVFGALLAPGGMLLVSVPNDAKFGVENPYHLWKGSFDEVSAWLRERFPHLVAFAQVHTVGSAVWPEAMLGESAPGVVDDARLRRIDRVGMDDAVGYLFACSHEPIAPTGPGAAQLVSGFDYVRELETRLATSWEDTQRLLHNWEQNRDTIQRLEGVRDDLRARIEASTGNTDRLGRELEAARAHLGELEARAARDAEALDEIARRRDELSAERDALVASGAALRRRRAYRLLSALGLLPRGR